MFQRTPVALALALVVPAAAFAQSTPATAGDDLVVTATRSPQAARNSVRPVQVITAEDIRLAGVTGLPALLRTLAGVEVTSNGGLGQSSSLFMRGANSDHTVVLVDGVRIGSTTLGTAPLESIPLALIERVEVLSGPASSLYGADAIGGVVQVFTKSAKRSPGVDVALSAGDNGLAQLAGSYAGVIGSTELALGANLLRWILGLGFIAMAGWMLIPDKLDDAEEAKPVKGALGILGTTIVAFFFAEMGDKTQKIGRAHV